MTIEVFILYNVLMLIGGWVILRRHGDKEYGDGITDAVQLHHEGKLTYTSYLADEGHEMLDIKIQGTGDEG
jgi:hypothetical protein